ncbi:TetR/AcrR family transcriptional regulator [Pseudonocardia sp. TRM90224]|uniref:TetR/AcrR family transcriptional regulator n=1 Tax=Pseudonocardia sp. TRM90224 TaxID=2812678 RepID=UPI001E5F9D1B|nr:TetR/AcrR family transcriptional regulator [Pseudonocardia sp. TRM90224]
MAGAGWTAPGVAETEAARPQRPRSVRAREKVLEATDALLTEGGLPAATIDAISVRSGVSKATIYKHWPSRTAVAAEAFGQRMSAALPLPDTGSAHGDFSTQARLVSEFYGSPAGAVFAQLLAASVTDPDAAVFFRAFFLAGRRRAIGELWQRALDRGEVDPDIDVEVAQDVLFGPLVFRLLSGHAPLTPELADQIADAALHGLLSDTARDR